MDKSFQAVYESGVLKPLESLPLNDREVVTLIVAGRNGSQPIEDEWHDIIDHDAITTAEQDVEGELPLDELRRRLSKIQGSMSDIVISERGDY